MTNCAGLGCLAPRGVMCHCGGCHETFSNITLFEDHQSFTPVFHCRPVADWSAGLVQDEEGVWWTPEGLVSKARNVERLQASKQARTGT